MEINVIFDRLAVNKTLYIGWGFSVLVDNRILFDTGEKGEWILNNLKQLDININNDIKGVVISHDHWDHTGGLETLLKSKKGRTPVYVCPKFSVELKKQIVDCGGKPVETKNCKEIAKNVYVTGEIMGRYKGNPMPEQALVLKTGKGISVITGCAHPGILEMLDQIKSDFQTDNLCLVMGGFHLLDEDKRILDFIVSEFKKTGVGRVGPTHCSGPKAEAAFAKEYGERFIRVQAGQTLDI